MILGLPHCSWGIAPVGPFVDSSYIYQLGSQFTMECLVQASNEFFLMVRAAIPIKCRKGERGTVGISNVFSIQDGTSSYN